jgi:hypothetical protein
MRANARAIPIEALRDAHRWLDELLSDPRLTLESIASREDKSERSIRMTLSLAFLAPDIVKTAVEGRLPRGFGLKRLVDLPMAWPDQWRGLGAGAGVRNDPLLARLSSGEGLVHPSEPDQGGYANDDALPDYRVTNTNSKGILFGAFGSKIQNQPIPTLVLKEHHRALVEVAHLRSPIASYQLGTKGEEGEWRIPWSPNLVAIYQAKFYEGAFALVSAWQELPTIFIAALLDTVRNRVLRLALELQEELGSVGDDPAALRPE